MITESPLLIEPLTETITSESTELSWNQQLKGAFRNVSELLSYLDLGISDLSERQAASISFPVLVPKPFADLMETGNIHDPLLLQVLPQSEELEKNPDFIEDPLAEKHTNIEKGLIHKYNSRVLLIVAGGCAVNCRYCFRRHFPYENNRLTDDDWNGIYEYLKSDNSIDEVIFSGGDPLMLSDQQLAKRIQQLEKIPHLKRLRIHSRLPVVIPSRITEQFIKILHSSKLDCVMVFHINHAHEISSELIDKAQQLRAAKVHLLNQSVLLKHINDTVETQVALSLKLFESGILPYYLHLLDRVAGAHHFEVNESQAKQVYQGLINRLSGYLIPKLVREESGKGSKTPVPI